MSEVATSLKMVFSCLLAITVIGHLTWSILILSSFKCWQLCSELLHEIFGTTMLVFDIWSWLLWCCATYILGVWLLLMKFIRADYCNAQLKHRFWVSKILHQIIPLSKWGIWTGQHNNLQVDVPGMMSMFFFFFLQFMIVE